jgi:hypothetical protein
MAEMAVVLEKKGHRTEALTLLDEAQRCAPTMNARYCANPICQSM